MDDRCRDAREVFAAMCHALVAGAVLQSALSPFNGAIGYGSGSGDGEWRRRR